MAIPVTAAGRRKAAQINYGSWGLQYGRPKKRLCSTSGKESPGPHRSASCFRAAHVRSTTALSERKWSQRTNPEGHAAFDGLRRRGATVPMPFQVITAIGAARGGKQPRRRSSAGKGKRLPKPSPEKAPGTNTGIRTPSSRVVDLIFGYKNAPWRAHSGSQTTRGNRRAPSPDGCQCVFGDCRRSALPRRAALRRRIASRLSYAAFWLGPLPPLQQSRLESLGAA